MRVRVINPNTSAAMTRSIADSAQAAAWVGVDVSTVSSEQGPASIESHYDEAMAAAGLLAQVRRGEAEGVGGYVVACFGDPALQAARELAAGPVVGIAEAAMRAACYVGRSFSVVTSLERTIGRARDLASAYGVAHACAGVWACGIGPLDLEADPRAYEVLTRRCAVALDIDGSDVIVLGCAGMAAWAGPLSAELGVPVVDGVAAAVATVQGLLAIGLRTSERCEYAAPVTARPDSFDRLDDPAA